MSQDPICPQCKSENSYSDGNVFICPDCSHEWNLSFAEPKGGETSLAVRDANGNLLQDGDSVTVIKDLRLKGSSSVVKVGTKVKGIRLLESSDGHNISCKIDSFGSINLKSEFVKKQ